MNRDSDAIESLLSWLLQVSSSDPDPSIPPGKSAKADHDRQAIGDDVQAFEFWDSLEAEDQRDDLWSNQGQAEVASLGEAQPFILGEIPAVQDHVYTLLKRRLKAEIERRPPLFPWETEICDYPIERSDWSDRPAVPSSLWTDQFQSFRWPMTFPEEVLTTLMERCQTVVQTTIKQGRQLVQSVEALFPSQTEALNHLAGLVLASASPSRGSEGGLAALAGSPASKRLPADYEAATAAQQMVLSLLAAHDILKTLTLTVSPQQPQLQRDW